MVLESADGRGGVNSSADDVELGEALSAGATDESDLIHPKAVRHFAVWEPFVFYRLGFEVIAFALLMAYLKRERWL